MILTLYMWLGVLLRGQIFDVNNGNDDKLDLIHPERYGLTETQNLYIKVVNRLFVKNSDLFI